MMSRSSLLIAVCLFLCSSHSEGTVDNIEWIERNGKFSGSGVVSFSSEEAAQKAIAKNGSDLLGSF